MPRTVFAASATAFSAAFAKLSLDVPTTSIIFCVIAVLLVIDFSLWIVPLPSPHPRVSETTIVATCQTGAGRTTAHRGNEHAGEEQEDEEDEDDDTDDATDDDEGYSE